ncbi:6-pyruvoyl trahydropterin synthase family protein [Lignipirellula cremea]|uniref:6-carboxy-5,6,7,8-tetrahydropterin synthase n=1 Tax=Lignipirellula cremea TaxID=2528010 RepID=A0A518DT72_9BACT|nr:6-pyruvoyl tetrahydropterin synthase family protein [Lignipirellula cremea]QDU95023.1 6-pyruvoyl tetrahydropterin synthase [Lignipirellula cremea]
MTASYRVFLEKEQLVFSAAHFITFNGNICERLHGHNWRVSAEVSGPLDENSYVIDFIALRDELQAIIAELDHRMLLPTGHPTIEVHASEREVEARFEDRRWVFPREDCILLPIINTTAELIAHYLAGRLLAALKTRGVDVPERLVIGVDENFGQWALCELTPSRAETT